MLQIGKKQMTLMDEHSRLSFESQLRDHLQRFFPDHCLKLGDNKMGVAIQLAIERAGHYGIESEHGVCVYADLMFAFGHQFDEDQAHPWATRILRDPSIHDPSDRIERLYEAAMTALAKGTAAETTS